MAKKDAAKKAAPPTAKTQPAKGRAVAPAKGDFAAVFARLRTILTPYAPEMVVVKNDPQWYYLDTHSVGANKKPIAFAAVRLGKNFVGFYLMPLYMNPTLQARVSPALSKRKQGKTCFNFAAVDEGLFAELEALTKAGHECFRKTGWA
jgi:hypothetical protein